MVKNDKDLKNEINAYFDKDIPMPDAEECKSLQNRLRNSTAREKSPIQLIKKLSIAFMVLLVIIPAIVLPFVLNKEEKYYSDLDLTEVKLEYEDAKNAITTNYPNYESIFGNCTLYTAYGYYTEKNQLISILCEFEKNDIPFTSLNLQIDLTNNYKNPNKEAYMCNANITKNANYTLYEREVEETTISTFYKLLVFKNYSVYLSMNIEDTDILNIFM